MDQRGTLLKGVAVGALAMYILDPQAGRRRRAFLRDKLTRAAKETSDGADDAVIESRVRSKLGRLVSHPSAIDVEVQGGRVRLRGPILERDAPSLVNRLRKLRGVRDIDDQLQVHRSGESVPDLQGSGAPWREVPELLEKNWSPATRVLVGAGAGFLAVASLRRGSWLGYSLGAVGAAFLARSLTNRPARRLVRGRNGHPDVHFTRTLHIEAPIDRAFEFWSHYENFPRFMPHIREVRDLGNRRSHWVASGPAGIPIEWDSETTELEPNRRLAWRSVEGSALAQVGVVRFDPGPYGTTRVTVHFAYSPPAGELGHAVAKLFGKNPERVMDEGLQRLKALLEARPTAEYRGEQGSHVVAHGLNPSI